MYQIKNGTIENDESGENCEQLEGITHYIENYVCLLQF